MSPRLPTLAMSERSTTRTSAHLRLGGRFSLLGLIAVVPFVQPLGKHLFVLGRGFARRPVATRAAPGPTARGALGDGALGERQQGQLTGRLDGDGHLPLMLGAVAGHAAGADLAAVAHETAEEVDVLVVDPLHVLLAEHADLLFAAGADVLADPLGAPVTIVVACHVLERLLVVSVAGGRLVGNVPGGVAATAATAAAGVGRIPGGAPIVFDNLGRRPAQAGADLVGHDLDDGFLIAFLCLVAPLLQAAGHDH